MKDKKAAAPARPVQIPGVPEIPDTYRMVSIQVLDPNNRQITSIRQVVRDGESYTFQQDGMLVHRAGFSPAEEE